jgi:hypothetical protein
VALERHRENTAHTINISRAKRNRGGCCKSGGCGNNGDGAAYGAGDMSGISNIASARINMARRFASSTKLKSAW